MKKILKSKLNGPVKWGEPVPCNGPGIYIVVTPDQKPASLSFSKCQIECWIKTAQDLKIGNKSPTEKNIRSFLKKFWFKNEIILYVGKAVNIRRRVGQYYNTEIGRSGPHKGGYWIKTLSFLDRCLIFWAEADDPELTEEKILRHFHSKLSKGKSKEETFLPFANLELRIRKQRDLKDAAEKKQ